MYTDCGLQDSVRVIVDYATSSRPTGEEFDEEFVDDVEVADDEVCTCGLCVRKYAGLAPYPPDIHDESDICPQDQWPEKLPFIKQHKQYGPGAKSDAKDGTWTEDPLIFCPGRAWAFSLKQKSWKHVEVEKLDAVRTPRDPFKDLVLDDDYKMVVESLVDTYLGGSIFSDIVRDKGRGLVVLLHGGPGTGKTLTAGKSLVIVFEIREVKQLSGNLTNCLLKNALLKRRNGPCTWSLVAIWAQMPSSSKISYGIFS